MINLWDYKEFCDCSSSFYRTSLDDSNDVHLSNSLYDEVVDMDKVKEYFEEHKWLESMDALTKIKNQLFFIEFKNCDVREYKKEIFGKANCSVGVYSSVTGESPVHVAHSYDCIVVYAENKNSRKAYGVKQIDIGVDKPDLKISSMRKFGDWLAMRAKTEIVLFGMHEMQGRYFRVVHTYSEKRFDRFLRDNGIID